MVDADGNMSGYYYDLMKLLQEKQHFEYEFVISTLDEGLNQLVDGKLDIMLGIPMNVGQGKGIIFNRQHTNAEKFGIFSSQNMRFKDLYTLKELKLGMVKGDVNAEGILDLLKINNIDNVRIIYGKDYKDLAKLMEEGQVDLIVDNKWNEEKYFLVDEFIGEDVYIAGNKESSSILNSLDQAIEQEERLITALQEKYFGSTKTSYIKVITISIATLILIIGVVPLINRKIIKNKIRLRMSKKQYILYYQPIYNPRTNTIVGFEGLLRLLGKNNKIIPPSKIIPEIEKNNMLFEISLWLIEKVIEDYNKIKNSTIICEKDFYLSVNLSLKELENDVFVDRAISLLKESHLGHQKICLEIVERFKMDDIDKITQNIKRLKEAGFKLAIDDFGVEYSNLDIFQKLDVDIIKVDKMLVDGIGKDAIKEEIVLFISRLAHIANRSVVLEGIEEAGQDAKIKKIENDRVYVQGYYYKKPICIQVD